MNYLRKKLQAIMASADFKGYLREVAGTDSVTLTDCMGSDMVSLSLVGNAVQDGTPSPDNPVEIQGCGDRTANLFDISGSVAISGGTIAVEGTKITFTTTDNCYGVTLAQNIQLKPNTAYTVSYRSVTFDGSYGGSYGLRVNCDGIWGSMEYGKTYCNFTTGDVGVVTINYYVGMPYQGEIGKLLVLEEPMLVIGSYTAETVPVYEPYGYKVPVKVGGINLFDVSQITDSSVITRDGDKLILNDYACASQLSPEDFLEITGLQPGDTITTTRDVSVSKGVANNITGRISFVGKSGRDTYILVESSALRTSVIPDDFDSEHYTSAYFYGASTPDENGDRIAEMSNIMIVKGSYTAATIPPYEPYHEPQTFNVYMDKPLYGQDGEPWSEVVYDGTEGWYTNSTSDDGTMIKYFLASQTKVGAAGARECACTHYPKTTISSTPWFEQDTCRAWGFVSQKGWFGICVNAADYPTVDDWKAFLQAQYAAGTPVKAYFAAEGSAPAETKVPTYKGTTIIFADTAIQPSSMTAQYYATKKED